MQQLRNSPSLAAGAVVVRALQNKAIMRYRSVDHLPPASVQRKLTVLGYRAVGKTALTAHYVKGRHDETYEPTIENTFQKTIREFRSVQFITEIVDAAGMDEYSRLSRNASVGVHGYLLLYSTISRTSFEKVQIINDMLIAMQGGASDVPRVLVGTMIDCADRRQVSYEEGQALARRWNVPFVECSAKEDINVGEVFRTLVREIERDNGLLIDEPNGRCVVM